MAWSGYPPGCDRIAGGVPWVGFEAPSHRLTYFRASPKSTVPDMWTAAHADPESFFSERFTSFGELFCYVKLDGSEGLDEEKFADKAEIEDALDGALRAHACGAFIGGGTGLKYSYVDLALSDTERGIDVVREVLRAGNVPKRSWIQFFDAHLAAEWIGIYPDSPQPPMPDD